MSLLNGRQITSKFNKAGTNEPRNSAEKAQASVSHPTKVMLQFGSNSARSKTAAGGDFVEEVLCQLAEVEDLARISPLLYQHVIPNRTCHFTRPKPADEVA